MNTQKGGAVDPFSYPDKTDRGQTEAHRELGRDKQSFMFEQVNFSHLIYCGPDFMQAMHVVSFLVCVCREQKRCSMLPSNSCKYKPSVVHRNLIVARHFRLH